MIVNHNGFVVKHPLLKTQELWNIDPPSLDMLDAEIVRYNSSLKFIEGASEQIYSIIP